MAIAPVNNIAIVGGTHGNELTGVYLIQRFRKRPELIERPSLTTTTVLANPQAIACNRRYVERDLNRCFDPEDLKNPALSTYEDRRAKEIAAQLCPSDGPSTEFIIDIHSTTSNMGTTLLLSSDHPFNLRLAAYLCSVDPEVRVCFRFGQGKTSPMLRSLCPLGCTLEIGPICPGLLHAQQLRQTEQFIGQMLDYLDAWNSGQPPKTPSQLTVYQSTRDLDYPRDQNQDITAMIHPELQGRDYQPLRSGSPLFMTFDGEIIPYSGNDTAYPIFINEVAYYEKRIAIALTQKRSIAIEE